MQKRLVTNKELNELEVTYGSVEAKLNQQGFDIKWLIRDVRHDWGDDGGFLISSSKKDNKFYLHVINVNYNEDIKGLLLEPHDRLLGEGESNDFILFNTESVCTFSVSSYLLFQLRDTVSF